MSDQLYTNTFKSITKSKFTIFRYIVLTTLIIFCISYVLVGLSLPEFGLIISLVCSCFIGPTTALFLLAMYKVLSILLEGQK